MNVDLKDRSKVEYLDSIRRPSCDDDLETAKHIFVDCSFAIIIFGIELRFSGVWLTVQNNTNKHDKGGLGVSSICALNRALMFKWVWRFIAQGSSLWARVIKMLHGYDGKIGQKVKSCYPSLWLDIIRELSHSGLDVSFRRPPRGGVEIQQFEHMKEKAEGCILANMMDIWFWALEGSGEFTIMPVRKLIDDFMLPEVSSKTRWIKA
nr:RNA-directed DNA polymerase, eukaryota, reverse transcriptase zinc-binding domain protein [Tanacetum cinerariifolium]